ncbi:MAG: response regulator [Bacteroidales bacterium]|nr:response regulator [Bacteroidales bacterium]MCF8333540.1 response regulator [Bacteroidales bacterium]
MQRNKLIVTIIAFLLFSSTIGQNMRFHNFSIDDGLSQNSVYDIHQDSLGFVWLATQEGLNRFDGQHFKIYKHQDKDSSSIINNFISDITPYMHKKLWIGTLEGVSLYSHNKDEFNNSFAEGEAFKMLQNTSIEGILVDKQNVTWFGGDKGLFSYVPNEGVKYYSFLDSLSVNKTIYKAFDLSDEKLLLGTSQGAFTFNKVNKTFQRLPVKKQGTLKDKKIDFVYDILEDDSGRIWMASTGRGLIRYDRKTKQAHLWSENDGSRKPNLEDDMITELEISPKGNLWIGGYNGLQIVNFEDSSLQYIKHKSYRENSIARGEILSLMFDEADNCWIGTSGGGVSIHSPLKNKFHLERNRVKDDNSLPSDMVMALLKEKNETVWVGTDGNGLHKYHPDKNSYTTYQYERSNPQSLNSSFVISLHKDLSGRIWAGTYGWGVNVYNRKQDNFQHFADEAPLGTLNEETINWITQSSDSTYWFATMNGLYYFENIHEKGKHLYSTDTALSIPNNQVWTVFEDHQNYIWVGTLKGMVKLNSQKRIIKIYSENSKPPRKLPANSVHNFAEDHENRLWIGTDEGICRLDREKDSIVIYRDQYGLPDGVIYDILHHEGALWMSTNQGLYEFEIENKVVHHYTQNDGLQSKEFNDGAAYKAEDSEMFFGGIKGYNRFYPDSIKVSKYNPEVLITNLKIFNESVGIGEWKGRNILSNPIFLMDKIELSHTDRVITFEFASLDVANPADIEYKYKMEGFDDTWTHIKENKAVTYTSLDPGNYTFVVKGTNADGVWSQDKGMIQITITPPFYQTTWFKIGVILLVILLIYLIIKIREKRINNEKLKLEKLVNERTQQLSNKNKELEEHRNNLERLVKERTSDLQKAKEEAEASDRLKTAFLTNMSHEVRTPMNAIIGFSDILKDTDLSYEERKEYVELIHANSNKLLELIDDIVDLSRLETEGLQLTMEQVEVNSLLEEIYQQAIATRNNQGKKEQLDINQYQPSDKQVLVQADRSRLKQVMYNLVNNAIKFTSRGSITIGYQVNNDSIEFFVKDTGIGIEATKQNIIFQRFRQLDDSHTRKFGGTGLGLALVKVLLEKMGGQIQLDSEYGKGSRFYFYLPVEQKGLSDAGSATKISNLQVPDLKGKKLILATNDESSGVYLMKLLKNSGAELIRKNNGKAVYEEVINSQGNVNMIIMDIELPIMPGYLVIEKIKSKYPHIIVIAQFSDNSDQQTERCKHAGCDAYLVKPIRKEKLFSKIHELLKI